MSKATQVTFKLGHENFKKSVLQVHLISDAQPDEQIAVYAPHNHIPTKLAIIKLKARYVSDDRSWRLPVSMLSEVVEAFSEDSYHYSEAFKKAFASAISPPRVDLLRDEHPERCIVVSGFTEADEYFKCKVSHLDGVYNESDNTWRFCLDTLPLLLAYFHPLTTLTRKLYLKNSSRLSADSRTYVTRSHLRACHATNTITTTLYPI